MANITCKSTIGGFLAGRRILARLLPQSPHVPGGSPERGTCHGALSGAIGGAVAGPVLGAYFGAGWVLTLAYGEQRGHPFVFWLTVLGFAAAAARGLFAVRRTSRGLLPGL